MNLLDSNWYRVYIKWVLSFLILLFIWYKTLGGVTARIAEVIRTFHYLWRLICLSTCLISRISPWASAGVQKQQRTRSIVEWTAGIERMLFSHQPAIKMTSLSENNQIPEHAELLITWKCHTKPCVTTQEGPHCKQLLDHIGQEEKCLVTSSPNLSLIK